MMPEDRQKDKAKPAIPSESGPASESGSTGFLRATRS